MPSLTINQRRPVYGTGKKITYSDTAGQITLPAETRTVIIRCTTDAYVRVGAVATNTDFCLPAGIMAEIPVNNPDGGPIIVSAIRDTADGTFYCIAAAE